MQRARHSLVPILLLATLCASGAAAQEPLEFDFGLFDLGEIVTGCFSGCFGDDCDGSGTVSSMVVNPPFFVRGLRVGPASAGTGVCSNANPGLTTPATLPVTIGPGEVLVWDVDIVATEVGDFDELLLFDGIPLYRFLTSIEPLSGCDSDDVVFCLQNERFKVLANWRRPNGTRNLSTAVENVDSADSGLYWFFDPDNWELLVKVINGCNGSDGAYWVFAAATTNVEYNLVVTDTWTNTAKSYFKAQGPPAPAITDTAAFPFCP